MAEPAGIEVHSPESRVVYFDFGNLNEFQVVSPLTPDTLSGTPVILEPPAGLTIGTGFVSDGSETFVASSQANFRISGWKPNQTYFLICQATSTQGNTYSMRGRATCGNW